METPFLLETIKRHGTDKDNSAEFRFIRQHGHAKMFRLDAPTTAKLRDLCASHAELWVETRKFAKPPFEEVFVEFTGIKGDDGETLRQYSILWAHNKVLPMFVNWKGDLVVSSAYGEAQEEGFLVKLFKGQEPFQDETDRTETTDRLLVDMALMEVLWLLLHQPGVVKLTGVPTKQKVIKGKLRPLRAHSVLTIDLAQKEIVRRIAQNGSRGSGVREHEVRGTWVHLKRDFGCPAHDWQPVERPVWEPKTYDCPLCGTRRVWRKDHVRGEHKRGNIFHTYEVTDSRLTKKGRPRNAGLVSDYRHIPSGAGGPDHPAHP